MVSTTKPHQVFLTHSTNPAKPPATLSKCSEIQGWILKRCEHGSAWIQGLRCRSCEGCLQYRKNIAVAKIQGGIALGEMGTFLTLTSLL